MKLSEIHKEAGFTSTQALDFEALEKVIDEDFNPEVYDEKMRLLFGGEYYGEECVKPVFEDDIDIGDIIDDEEEIENNTLENEDVQEEDYVEKSDEGIINIQLKSYIDIEPEIPFKEISGEAKSELSKALDEYHKMDYEDMVNTS